MMICTHSSVRLVSPTNDRQCSISSGGALLDRSLYIHPVISDEKQVMCR